VQEKQRHNSNTHEVDSFPDREPCGADREVGTQHHQYVAPVEEQDPYSSMVKAKGMGGDRSMGSISGIGVSWSTMDRCRCRGSWSEGITSTSTPTTFRVRHIVHRG